MNNAIASMMRVRPNVGGTSYTSPTSDGILGTRVTRPSENRIGVYWQVQGSGKSYARVFFIQPERVVASIGEFAAEANALLRRVDHGPFVVPTIA